ncbi:4-alpha-glucanotransferase [Rhodopseudomonas rhenobacensis]|uniref:4-alpha-glucanotransferase n=1 Tax=Rhodopseudomonas rhenobacensis TaxID=87461 RepID=A0A7W8DYU2_9BRAD|nr:4-alpha-glucanotransferase [Rhodopseudomonas rhenobacensis]
MNSQQIRRLAADCGIAADYVDARGGTVGVADDVLLRLLNAMGMLGPGGEVAEALQAAAVLPPAMVIRAERGRIAITLSDAVPQGKIAWQVRFENGKRRRGETEPTRARPGSPRQLVLSDIPYGYHQLTLEAPEAHTVLIVTPGRCWLPENVARGGRSFGISLQLYLLRSARNWGIGDFGDLAQFAKLSASHGCDVLGLNPLHQMFPDNPEHASPYSPASRRFLNVLYIDVPAIPEFRHSARARALLEQPAFSERLSCCRAAAQVDYRAVNALKLEALRLVHADFHAHADQARGSEFDGFVKEAGESLHNTSLFQALRDHFTATDPALGEWQRWPDAFRRPDSPELMQFAHDHRDNVDFYNWLQWIADQQLAAAKDAAMRAGMRIGLYRDLAVGCDRTGSETWASPTDFMAQTQVGAPPDIFNPAGQNWGLPPFNPIALMRQGYRPFVDLVQSNMRHAGGLRIDHVMGLQRLYCIPEGLPASQGAYISYPLDDLIGILALESHRHQCLVVGEDLGTVPPGFRERMAEANILSYRVLFFEHDELGEFFPPELYPRLAVAVAGSHDLPTLRSWLAGTDIDLKHRLGLYPTPEETLSQGVRRDAQRLKVLRMLDLEDVEPISAAAFSEAVHRFLGRTASVLAVTQLDDLLDEHDPVNVPATSHEHPNWRRRYAHSIDSLTEDHPAWRLLEIVAAERRPSGHGKRAS